MVANILNVIYKYKYQINTLNNLAAEFNHRNYIQSIDYDRLRVLLTPHPLYLSFVHFSSYLDPTFTNVQIVGARAKQLKIIPTCVTEEPKISVSVIAHSDMKKRKRKKMRTYEYANQTKRISIGDTIKSVICHCNRTNSKSAA